MSDDEGKSAFKTIVHDSNVESMSGIEEISSVHVDKAMVAVDSSTKTATVSLITMHVIPKFSGQFDVEGFTYELVGELKIPFNIMDALAAYYLSARTSKKDELFKLIQKYLAEHPASNDNEHVPYGPLSVK